MPTISKIVNEIKPSATLSLKEEIDSLEKEYCFKIVDLTLIIQYTKGEQ